MGLHPVMGTLGELGRGGSELHGGCGHGERLVLLGGEGGFGILVSLERVLPAFGSGGELVGGRRVGRLRIPCLLEGLERGLEGHALLLKRGRRLLQTFPGGSGGVRSCVELGARIA